MTLVLRKQPQIAGRKTKDIQLASASNKCLQRNESLSCMHNQKPACRGYCTHVVRHSYCLPSPRITTQQKSPHFNDAPAQTHTQPARVGPNVDTYPQTQSPPRAQDGRLKTQQCNARSTCGFNTVCNFGTLPQHVTQPLSRGLHSYSAGQDHNVTLLTIPARKVMLAGQLSRLTSHATSGCTVPSCCVIITPRHTPQPLVATAHTLATNTVSE